MGTEPELFPQCPVVLGCSRHRAESLPRASAHHTPPAVPDARCKGERVKGDAAGLSETTIPPPTPGEGLPSGLAAMA